jgi:hypothetical protein
MSYQWLEAGVVHHREVLMQEAEQERLLALARASRRRPWLPPTRARLAQVLRAVARAIEPRERAQHATASGCASC